MSTKTFKGRMAELSDEITRLRFHAKPRYDDVSRVLEEVILVVENAAKLRDYQYLASLQPLIRHLGNTCMKLIGENDTNLNRFTNYFQVESETYLSFVRDIYPTLPDPQADILLNRMIENLICHETYYSAAKPRIAEELLGATLVNTKSPKHAIELCEAICQVNNTELSGINSVVRALDSSKTGMDSVVLQSTLQWIKNLDYELAIAVKEGGITDYVIERSAASAAGLGLPLTAANLAIRSDSFDFQWMAEIYEQHGVYSDSKHVEYIINKVNTDVLSAAAFVAFSLVYVDILPEDMTRFNVKELLTLAARDMKELELEVNPKTAMPVLTRLVEHLPSSTDISELDKSILAPYLRKIRKFNGFRLEDALGL